MKLSARHKRFIREFLQDCNATAAAQRAGYSPRSAKNAGHRLMQRPEIQEAIAEAQATLAQEAIDSAKRIRQDLLDCYAGAAEDRAWSAVHKLIELRAKLEGMLTERKDEKPAMSWADLMRLADES